MTKFLLKKSIFLLCGRQKYQENRPLTLAFKEFLKINELFFKKVVEF
jgi:hypothetical protein